MDFSKEQQIRIMIYATMGLLLIIGGGLFYLVWKDSEEAIPEEIAAGQNLPPARQKLETEVLETKKFKELEKVVVTDTGASTSTPKTSDKLTPAQLKEIRRRNANPFIPFN